MVSVFFEPDSMTKIEPTTTTPSPAHVIKPGSVETPAAAPMSEATRYATQLSCEKTCHALIISKLERSHQLVPSASPSTPRLDQSIS